MKFYQPLGLRLRQFSRNRIQRYVHFSATTRWQNPENRQKTRYPELVWRRGSPGTQQVEDDELGLHQPVSTPHDLAAILEGHNTARVPAPADRQAVSLFDQMAEEEPFAGRLFADESFTDYPVQRPQQSPDNASIRHQPSAKDRPAGRPTHAIIGKRRSGLLEEVTPSVSSIPSSEQPLSPERQDSPAVDHDVIAQDDPLQAALRRKPDHQSASGADAPVNTRPQNKRGTRLSSAPYSESTVPFLSCPAAQDEFNRSEEMESDSPMWDEQQFMEDDTGQLDSELDRDERSVMGGESCQREQVHEMFRGTGDQAPQPGAQPTRPPASAHQSSPVPTRSVPQDTGGEMIRRAPDPYSPDSYAVENSSADRVSASGQPDKAPTDRDTLAPVLVPNPRADLAGYPPADEPPVPLIPELEIEDDLQDTEVISAMPDTPWWLVTPPASADSQSSTTELRGSAVQRRERKSSATRMAGEAGSSNEQGASPIQSVFDETPDYEGNPRGEDDVPPVDLYDALRSSGFILESPPLPPAVPLPVSRRESETGPRDTHWDGHPAPDPMTDRGQFSLAAANDPRAPTGSTAIPTPRDPVNRVPDLPHAAPGPGPRDSVLALLGIASDTPVEGIEIFRSEEPSADVEPGESHPAAQEDVQPAISRSAVTSSAATAGIPDATGELHPTETDEINDPEANVNQLARAVFLILRERLRIEHERRSGRT